MARCRLNVTLWMPLLAVLLSARAAIASEYRGRISAGGMSLPGATITVTRLGKTLNAASDATGAYVFPNLEDGTWHVRVEMSGFAAAEEDVVVAAGQPAARWELTMLPLEQALALTKAKVIVPTGQSPASPNLAAQQPTRSTDTPRPQEDDSQRPSDGLLVNGSTNNAARSKYSLDQAFGNNRNGSKSLYTGGLGVVVDNSALDARPYSLTGLESPKNSYNRITGIATLGGPIKIPHLLRHGPNFFLAYEWTRDSTATTEAGLVPTAAQRMGDLSGQVDALGQPVTIVDPATGLPFAGNVVPVSPQAQALLGLYPSPNIAGNTGYNYQIPVLNSSHQDQLLSRVDKAISRKDDLYGRFSFTSTRASEANLFGFTDKSSTLGLNASINESHRISQRLFLNGGYRFSRLSSRMTPFFADRANISGGAGITGNDQTPTYWGPPTLVFSGGLSSLTDAQASFNRARTDAFSLSAAIYRGRHNITVGGDLRKQQFNDLFQQDPRGTFAFTGAATQGTSASTQTGGSDLADFLLGVPDTSSIAFGNADKYLRQSVYDLYVADDWRVLPILTVNVGMRWEYGAPMTETKNRLVNLDVAPGFSAVAPVLATDPTGSLTDSKYPASLLRPDRTGFEPRLGVSWRPIAGSTVVVRAGYGIYHDTSVYQTSVLQLAQQAPLSKTFSVQNSATCALSLADGFSPCPTTTANTFAVDPNFRVGYAQTWQLAVQRDLPAALQLTATYLGVKGTRGIQQFLPNTYPLGAADPCPSCPSGYVYETTNGSSTRQSGQVQLRRRLRSGFTATMLYTFSHSIDNDATLGGQGHTTATSQTQGSGESTTSGTSQTGSAVMAATIAQNWLDLRAERSRSSFDQRHLLNLQAQYTSGQGLGGGALLAGWRGRLLKEWTAVTTIAAGTGLPQTPIYLAAIPGAGFTGTLRPDLTGNSIYAAPRGLHLNAAAYATPQPGQYGHAGRYSINGPSQFTLNASLARTFRPSSRFFLDAHIDATNLLNHGVFTSWIATVNSTQFGLPAAANPMRSLETEIRLRF